MILTKIRRTVTAMSVITGLLWVVPTLGVVLWHELTQLMAIPESALMFWATLAAGGLSILSILGLWAYDADRSGQLGLAGYIMILTGLLISSILLITELWVLLSEWSLISCVVLVIGAALLFGAALRPKILPLWLGIVVFASYVLGLALSVFFAVASMGFTDWWATPVSPASIPLCGIPWTALGIAVWLSGKQATTIPDESRMRGVLLRSAVAGGVIFTIAAILIFFLGIWASH